MARPLILGPALRPVCIILQILPVPGVGAIIAGIKNPHSKLLGRGIAQASLVIFGSYPLIIPGALGLIWAIVDAVAIARNSASDAPWTRPTADADPETVTPTRAQRAATRAAQRDVRRADKDAAKAVRAAERAAAKAQRAAERAARAEDAAKPGKH